MVRAAGHLLLLAALAAAQIPLANFSGAVHAISKKQIKPEEIMSGDQVTIQARQEMLRFLVAVVITVQAPPKDSR